MAVTVPGPSRSIISKIEKLKKEISRHDHLYYVVAEPEISDQEYDRLYGELLEIEKEYPELVTPDSPSQRVGGEPTKGFRAVQHSIQMLSLSNTYSEDDIRDFDRRVRELLPGETIRYVCELKFDGISLSLKYRGGLLELGATRGDGNQGDDITSNVKTIRSVPLKLNGSLSCEVRGEVVMNIADFKKMNEEKELSGEKTFANPRNSVAGTMKLQDPRIVASRPLRFFAYSFYSGETARSDHYENLKYLKKLGFLVDGSAKRFENIDGVIRHWREMEFKRETLPFDIDGVVVKVDSAAHQERLGSIARSPRWAIACKFSARKGETVLQEIRLQVGRLGTITPVALLEPVKIGGTMVGRASLYNDDYIREKDIRIGDTVTVERGGDVIPKVTSVVLEKRRPGSAIFVFPRKCPACGSVLVKFQDEISYYCGNSDCPMQTRGRIEHWAARGAMDIAGLGEAVVDRLVENKFVNNVADLYDLHKHKSSLLEMEGWGEKSVTKLLEGIEKSKGRKYQNFIFALGIRHVGATVARVLADKFNTIDLLMKATEADLVSVREVGPKIAGSIVSFFADSRNRKLVERFRKTGLTLSNPNRSPEGPLTGKVFVITGGLESCSRDRAKELIEESGGKVASTVTKNIDILIVGDSPGSKLDKARALHVEIWDEEKFMKFIGEAKGE